MRGTGCQEGPAPHPTRPACQAHLPQRLAQLAKDALLVKHLALVAVLVVVVDALPGVGRELVEGHVLLHLLVLGPRRGGAVSSKQPVTTPPWPRR